ASRVNLISGPTPAGPLTLGPGAAATFSWTFSMSGAGAFTASASAAGTDAGTGLAVSGGASAPGVIVGQAFLSARVTCVPGPARVGQQIQVRLTVTNTGGSTASGVLPSLQSIGGTGAVAFVGGPVPTGPLSLSP